MSREILHHYSGGTNQVVIHLEDGSVVYVQIGERRVMLSFAPDENHYPEPFADDGRYPSGPFTRHTG